MISLFLSLDLTLYPYARRYLYLIEARLISLDNALAYKGWQNRFLAPASRLLPYAPTSP